MRKRPFGLLAFVSLYRAKFILGGLLLAVLVAVPGAVALHRLLQDRPQTQGNPVVVIPPQTVAQPGTAVADESPTPAPAPSANLQSVLPGLTPQSSQPLLFGLGAQMEGAMRERLYREAPLKLLTSWYNGPNDLQFMRGWQTTIVPQAYASGHSLHLIVWAGGDEQPLNTKYGPACGRAYPLSAGFADDMRQLATIFRGSGTLYVSLFTEFQTYPCQDNTWQTGENYYRALKDQYRVARDIFKATAPNSQISLTWGGWQSRWDDLGGGGGRSLFPKFADIMNISDFQSFQAMDSTSNVQDITDMTRLLHAYGSGASSKVMVAHYKPDNASQDTWHSDLDTIFTPSNVAKLQQNGLFAFSFMDEKNSNASEVSYQQARNIIEIYSR